MKTHYKPMMQFIADERGAAFIEYTALLGVILAVGLVVLTKVGNWATSQWSTLCSGLGSNCQ